MIFLNIINCSCFQICVEFFFFYIVVGMSVSLKARLNKMSNMYLWTWSNEWAIKKIPSILSARLVRFEINHPGRSVKVMPTWNYLMNRLPNVKKSRNSKKHVLSRYVGRYSNHNGPEPWEYLFNKMYLLLWGVMEVRGIEGKLLGRGNGYWVPAFTRTCC